ncbi:uncharacterized protein K460DRAFT_352298 [Cucurbitaria berberidis CBS 394.84]|uniref:Uncharacterized protein n=1 Tax=Cucurbitaria berberidis CBS 394.84 TaxID=1168544 RepID=A0A9P4LA67_9PLEO|nr:uncharacterized protein K460DRAFT_352298 [Cucurbitaria berberidis CBS 394.84]KAF1847118.1 hypothetical protein K460DRAFT_352298 [Cucurbitaria berberidis CBS 394.84]
MPNPRRRGVYDGVEYVVVKRDGVRKAGPFDGIELEKPTATVDRIHRRRSFTRRQQPSPTDTDDESDDEDDHASTTPTIRTTPTLTIPTGTPALLVTMTVAGPQATIALAPQRPPSSDREGGISRTTEHLLIAAGSIGATIVIVMIILAIYTMRKRGLSTRDVVQRAKNRMNRGPPPPPKYDMDNKQSYDDDYANAKNKSVLPPIPAAIKSRSGSLSTKTPLQALGRSASQRNLESGGLGNRSFYNSTPSRQDSHRRDISATPSSPILPIQSMRRSASTRNTRSLNGDEEALQYSDSPQQRALPPAPTFRQFLSNRPSISHRPGLGGAMMSRFSWTNSNAPQTPHDPSRDTVAQPIGRDSFMTQRSSVGRFRTVDSWVKQQSNRVEEQRLKQQFRMTQSSTSSGEGDDVDQVPEMPAVPKKSKDARASSLPGKDIKHQRHDTTTTVQTAPIFKAHPGTEVRFSVRSEVPSEVLDMGRKNAAL